MTYKHGCASDSLTQTNELATVSLPIGDTHTATSTFTQTGGGCALTYVFQIYDDTAMAWKTYANAAPYNAYVTSYSAASVTIRTTDESFDKKSI